MGNPYLSSDESLILSTHAIRIDEMSLDLMLTSRRLILIDNSVTPFQLHTIPLETIITVVAGTDVKGDPIITLSHMDPTGTGAPLPMDFIFTRQKGERRVDECNEWAARLSNEASRARNLALSAGTLPYDPVKVIQPRMSATYRIETFSPRRPVIGEYPVKAEPVPAPVIPQSLVVDRVPAVMDEPAPVADAGLAEPSGSRQVPEREEEETGIPGAEISGAGEFFNSPEVTEALTESIVPAIPDDEIVDEIVEETVEVAADETVHEISPAYEEPSVHIPIPTATEVPFENNLTPEPVVTLMPEVLAKNDESPSITDAKRIWADAARSVVSSPALIPVIPAPVAVPEADITVTESPSAADTGRILPEVAVEERVEEKKEEAIPVHTHIPEIPVADEPGELPAPESRPIPARETVPETAPVPAAILPPVQNAQKHSPPSVMVAALVVIILVVLGVAVITSFHLLDSGNDLPAVIVPNITVQPVPTPVPTIVPADGVYVRIEYPGTYIGEVGNTELMNPVSGSGVQVYKILWSDRIVRANAQKQDYSGDTLTLELYKDGFLIKRVSTRVPLGSIDLLIDPTTGKPPGIKRGDIL